MKLNSSVSQGGYVRYSEIPEDLYIDSIEIIGSAEALDFLNTAGVWQRRSPGIMVSVGNCEN